MTKPQTDDPWRVLLEALPDGAVLTDAASVDGAVLYANPAFARLTGYANAELLGGSLPLFGDPAADPAGRQRLHEAMRSGAETRALLRGTHRDGHPLWLDVHTVPVRDATGRITHWASLFRAAEARATPGEHGTARHQVLARRPRRQKDVLTGLDSRAAFEAALERPAAAGAGQGPALTVFLVDVMDLAGYNDTFGRAAGDALLKRVAGMLSAAFRRSSDVLARWQGGTFAAVTYGMDAARVAEHADRLRARVRDMAIHHPRSRCGRFVSVAVAHATAPAGPDTAPSGLLGEAVAALEAAKSAGQPASASCRPESSLRRKRPVRPAGAAPS